MFAMHSLGIFITLVSTFGLSTAHAIEKRALPYGTTIYSCTVPGVVSLTFDDGPWIYTESVLDQLKAAGQRATFFVNGANYDSIYNYNSTVHRYITDGHQVGSHTWSHPHLPNLTVAQVEAEMTQLETAFLNILGYFPFYMRCPYFECYTRELSIMANLKYVVINVDIDTKDYTVQTEDTIHVALENYQAGLNNGGSLSLTHDPQPYTASTLVGWILQELANRGLQSVPVGDCLGDPPINWYRTNRDGGYTPSSSYAIPSSTSSQSASRTSSSISVSTSPTSTISPDLTCGGTNGYHCPSSAPCCSRYGWCGSTAEFCQSASCQTQFGTCSPGPGVGSVTTDGSCGGTNGWICTGSSFGSCCSQYNWCGSSTDHCGTGCQSSFGTCS